MSDSNEGSGKGPSKPAADTAGQKKPTALIDLKATEVKAAEAKSAASSAAQAAGGKPQQATDKPATATVDIKTQATPGATGTAGGKPADKPGDTRPAAASATPSSSSTSAATSAKTATTPAPAMPAARAGGGIGAVATHLFAGVAGGFLALLGADALAPQLGLNGASTGISELQRRIGAMEEAAAKAKPPAPSPELTQKLAAAEARLAKIEDAARVLPTLGEAQTKLASETQALSERLAKPVPGADAEKLSRLEETLGALAAAAANDPQSGRIPQLAQITGKLADLEVALNGQMAAVRKNVTQDVESRLGQATESAEQARAGVLRIDRDLGTVKTEAARNAQRIETHEQALRAVKDEAAGLKVTVDGLQAEITNQLKSVARPQDVSSALAPLNSKLAAVEQNLAGVVKSDDDRRANAERIVLSLELANLKRALDRGGAFASELAAVQKTAGGKLNLKALEAAKDTGVPTAATLADEFRTVAYAIIAADGAPGDGSVVDKLITSAKSIVRVRKSSADAADTSAEAIASRMDAALKANRLGEVASEAGKLSAKAKAAGAAWLAKVEARAGVDRAVADVEGQLKAAIGGKSAP
jgi:hypothetical protein